MLIEHYTLPEFHKVASGPTQWTHSIGAYWFGGLNKQQALDYAITGDESCVADAERMIDKINVELNVETTQTQWVSAPCGAYPCVPDYLANRPDCMRMRGQVPVNSPIHVFVSIMASSRVDADAMRKRSATIMALVMKLQQTRPIDLTLIMPWIDTLLTVTLESRPIDISTAAYCIAHPAFFRMLGHRVLMRKGFRSTSLNLNWDNVGKLLEVTPDDLLIESIVWGDPLTENPVEWVTNQIQKYNGREE